ncbi:neuferricin [Lepeophtheirus salmonis]|uniref:neuferricin n=1 Tax=Lepeophtheirus salmonis TaxID=72036 RepID=UPI001AE684A7|nr:neuferricin-like [Lepeophtheirus salmonis]
MTQDNSSKKPTDKKEDKKKEDECPIHNLVFIIGTAIVLIYSVYLYNPDWFHEYGKSYKVVKAFDSFFHYVEKYSPFQEFLNDETAMNEPDLPINTLPSGERIFTKDELKLYDGSSVKRGIYLAILGQVFDVTRGREYYGPNGGYSFFSGKDASRAFVTGEFNDGGLVDDVSGLSLDDYLGLAEWSDFYKKDYAFVGKVIGRFFDKNGKETPAFWELDKKILEAQEEAEKKSAEKKTFPPCNSEWNKQRHRVWCTDKSGGINRPWVGVPRKLYYPGRQERCACVRTFGPPSNEPLAKTKNGDLGSRHLKEYPDCPPESDSCYIK